METSKTKAVKAKTPKIETVKEDFWKCRDDLCAERIVKCGQHRIRAEVRRNPYDFQSYARVSAWTPENGWKVVTSIPFASTAMKTVSLFSPDPMLGWPATASKDLVALVNLALTTLA